MGDQPNSNPNEEVDPSAGVEQHDWRERPSEDYRRPAQKVSFRAAVARRLRRVYLPLLAGLAVVWLFHLLAPGDANGVVANAAIQNGSGTVDSDRAVGNDRVLESDIPMVRPDPCSMTRRERVSLRRSSLESQRRWSPPFPRFTDRPR